MADIPGVSENEQRQWFYNLGDGSRPVGPYVTKEKADAAFEAATPKTAAKPLSYYDPELEQFRTVTQDDVDRLISRVSRFIPGEHYAFRKFHTHIFFALLLLLASVTGWELNNLHHPVTLSFCAEGGSATGNQTLP